MEEANEASISNALNTVLSNPELIQQISGLINQPPTAPLHTSKATDDAPPSANDGIAGVLSNPTLMAKLPQLMALLKPLLSSTASTVSASEATEPLQQSPPQTTEPIDTAVPAERPHPAEAKDRSREELLLALKPFLSPERCAAVDTILRISRLGTVLKHLQ